MNKKANDEKPPFYVLIPLLHKEAKLLPIQMKLVLVTSGIPLINKKYWKPKSVIFYLQNTNFYYIMLNSGGCHGRDHMVVGFTTACAISAYHH